MTISVSALMLLIFVHFFADFIMQTDKMAQNKSSNIKWLSIHILVYSIFFIPFGLMFAIANGLAHWLTDYCSSKATTYLYKKEQRHWFFVVIGLDQAIHMATLVLLYVIMVG